MSLRDVEKTEWEGLCVQNNKSHYYTPMEKSQYLKLGIADNHAGVVQPFLHVGIHPIPKLTTTDNLDVPNAYTDVEVMWDIETFRIL